MDSVFSPSACEVGLSAGLRFVLPSSSVAMRTGQWNGETRFDEGPGDARVCASRLEGSEEADSSGPKSRQARPAPKTDISGTGESSVSSSFCSDSKTAGCGDPRFGGTGIVLQGLRVEEGGMVRNIGSS